MEEYNNDTVITLREKPMDEATLMEFVGEQVAKYKSHAELIGNPDSLTISEVNRALSEYSVVESALLSLQAISRIKARKYREDFENWFSDKYIFIRNRENREDLSAQKWLGQKEIERMVRVEFRFEFKAFKDIADMWDMRESFITRMLTSWNNHQFVLNTISKNLQAQVSIHNTGISREFD